VSTAEVVAPTSVRSVLVDDGSPLLGRLPLDGPLAWVRDGDGLVGWGVAARVVLTGPDQLAAGAAWWGQVLDTFDVDDSVGLPGSGPVAFASFAFDPASPSGRSSSVLVVPRVLLGRRGGRTWLTVVGDDPAGPGPVLAPRAPQGVRWSEGSRTVEQWKDAVREAVAAIARGELDKVVLARDVVATADAPVDVRHLLVQLAERYPSCWTFSVDGLVGATPELLVRRTGREVLSRVLAGTVRRLGDAAADGALADQLLGSDKDLEEHELAVHSVADALRPYCADLDVPEQPAVLRLRNVQHLATEVHGRLQAETPVLELAAALHPTAAVCGTPTATALALIRSLELMDRGRYAGAVGWVGADGDGELGIALRCAQVTGRRVRLFAGCGIVAGSDADDELAESQAKLVPVREALDPDAPASVAG
jgi:menaquinone-specific isochorismate synthase